MSLEWLSAEEEDTIWLGKKLARIARKGDSFILSGTLGMGKSVLARAFVQELTKAQEVPSPTFTLVQIYEASGFDLYHYDLYRIKFPEEIFELGMEEALYQGVSLIEWPEKMGGYLPRDCFRIEITPFKGNRKITISSNNEEKLARLKSIL
jgi:tRNA threonylcarbamoyladenosine biosynthesis protein TsaE